MSSQAFLRPGISDEPTSDLDLETEKAIMVLIQQADQAGAAVILTTHDPGLDAYATRTLRLRAGRIEPFYGTGS